MIKPLNSRQYDLEKRTASFGINVITLCRKIREDNITKPLINQLVRSATSIGANYMEANGASSRKDFANKIYICKKEAQETKHWLRMIAPCVNEDIQNQLRELWQECQELVLIFNKITTSLKPPQQANEN